jgi:hypothetical protein
MPQIPPYAFAIAWANGRLSPSQYCIWIKLAALGLKVVQVE